MVYAFFVTRMKRGILYNVVERHEMDHSKGSTSDQVILLAGAKAKESPIPLCRIGYRNPETGKNYVFLININHRVAKTICAGLILADYAGKVVQNLNLPRTQDFLLCFLMQPCTCLDRLNILKTFPIHLLNSGGRLNLCIQHHFCALFHHVLAFAILRPVIMLSPLVTML